MDPHLWTLNSDVSSISKPEGNIGGYILLLIVLIALNAFFAAVELAIVSLNEPKLEKMANEGNKKAKTLFNMTKNPTNYLATIQIGVTLSGFLGSAVAADTFADYVVYWLRNSNLDLSVIRILSIFIITLILSYITLVFGELLPKRIAMANYEKVAFGSVGIIQFVTFIFKPIVWIVSKTVDYLARLFGIREIDDNSEYSEEEIRIMVDAGNERGLIESDQREMINNVFEFNDRTVGEIMTHRTDMDSLEVTASFDETIKLFEDSGHSRIPVYEDDIDDIVGLLYFKDLIPLFISEDARQNFNIRDYLRDALFVYENLKCDDLFAEFQKKKVQVAIVLDEYGGTYGIVSMEDLLESIVGDIQDEYDDEDQEIEEINNSHFIVDGAALIDDVSEEIGIPLDSSENDTIGGLIMDKLGYVPDENEHPIVYFEGAKMIVKSMDDRSIDKIDIILVNKDEKEKG